MLQKLASHATDGSLTTVYRVVKGPRCYTEEKHPQYRIAMETLEGVTFRALCCLPGATGKLLEVVAALKEMQGLEEQESEVYDRLEKMADAGWLSKKTL